MSNVRIMVVEDDRLLMMYITDSLKKLNYEVVGVASTAEDAIALVIKLQPDLVLTDIVLADDGGDGVDVASYVHTHLDLPVVYLTSCDDEATLQRAKITEPYGYLLKPFNERELHTTIEMALYKHRMERKLKESEQWFATTLKSIGEAVIATDKAGLIKFMNPVAEVLTGWKQTVASGKDLREIFKISTDSNDSAHPLNKVLTNGFTLLKTNHATLTAKDGSVINVDYSASPIMGENMLINGIVLTFRDVTKHMQMEERIRKLSRAVEQSPSMVIITDTSGRIEYVNPKFTEIAGYNADELFGRTLEIVFAEEQDYALFLDAIKTGSEWTSEIKSRKIDGTYYWSLASIAPIRNHEGTITHFVLLQDDITERKIITEKLQKSQAKYRSLFMNLNDAFAYYRVIYDNNNIPVDYVVVTINDAFERIMNLRRDNVINKRITEVLHGIETLSFDWIGTLGTVALTGKSTTFEQCMDLTGKWYRVSAYSPEKDHFAIIFTDITERKQMEENLRRERDTVKSIFETSADAIVIFDINGHVIDCNQASLDLHRYNSKVEMLGKSQFTLIAPEDHTTIAILLSRLDVEGIVRNLPITIITKDNQKVSIELSASVVRDFTGKPIGYVGIAKERSKIAVR